MYSSCRRGTTKDEGIAFQLLGVPETLDEDGPDGVVDPWGDRVDL